MASYPCVVCDAPNTAPKGWVMFWPLSEKNSSTRAFLSPPAPAELRVEISVTMVSATKYTLDDFH